MPGQAEFRPAAVVAAALLLAGCMPRLHSPLELAMVAERCEVPPSELVQERDLKKILFLYTEAPSRPQLRCVRKWARRHHLHLAYIEDIIRTGP